MKKLNLITLSFTFALMFASSSIYEAEAVIRRTKTTKTPRNTKASKSPKASKAPKNTKSPKASKAPKKGIACKKVKSYEAAEGSFLDGIIEALVESQDFSSYCRDGFLVAREWFLDVSNHPTVLPKGDEEYYMTVRLSSLHFDWRSLSIPTHFLSCAL